MQAKPLKTMLVDDNPTFVRSVRHVLDHMPGIAVVACAADGVEALEMQQQWLPDLVLLDLSMPRLNGLEVARRLTRVNHAPTIFVLSMHDSAAYREAAAHAGVSAFVKKENFTSELLPLLEQLVITCNLCPSKR